MKQAKQTTTKTQRRISRLCERAEKKH